jgi:hypothetical protein
MKKITGLTVITFVILFNVYSNPVDTTEAKKVALNFFMQKSDTRLKNFQEREIEKTIVHTYNGHNSYYVFKFKPTGFVIVAADDARNPIIAWSTNSIFNEYDLPPAYIDWMEQYDWYIDSLITYNVSADSSIQKWNTLKENNTRLKAYSPYRTGFTLVDTEWGQSRLNDGWCGNNPAHDNGAYNKFCPEEKGDLDCNCGRCAAGCVAVAMAQIMKYWNYPVHNTYQDYDWCHMPPALDENSTTREIDAVARLIRDCGKKVNTKYCSWFLNRSCESSANTKNAINAYKDMGYNNNTIEYIKRRNTLHKWQNILQEELDNERPVLYRYYGKHAFVCDGYNYDDPYEFHFNWGWRGSSNDGFYDLDEMNPGNHNYSDSRRKHHAIIGIQPKDEFDCTAEVDICDHKNKDILYGGTIFNSSNILIENNDNKEYRAYTGIDLVNGFEVEDGAIFTASIVPCPITGENCAFYTNSGNLKNTSTTNIKDTERNNTELNNNDIEKITEDKKNISLYPNPTNNIINIVLKKYKLPVHVKIYTLSGTLIYNQRHNTQTFEINLSVHSKGIYLVKIISDDQCFHKKVIVQ